jgi:hypothetical protein
MFSRAQSLPLIRLIILIVTSLTICRANPKEGANFLVPPDNQGAPAVHHTDWRKTLQVEFKYTPTAPPDPAIPPEALIETPANPDVVVLPKYVVRETASDYHELEKALHSSMKSENKVLKKLGIGPHEVKFRHFSMGCYTLFFIPVAGGLRW